MVWFVSMFVYLHLMIIIPHDCLGWLRLIIVTLLVFFLQIVILQRYEMTGWTSVLCYSFISSFQDVFQLN